MWKWEIVFKSRSTGEEITIRGNDYPDKEIAQWMLAEWLHKFLPSFFLYQIEKSEVIYTGKEET